MTYWSHPLNLHHITQPFHSVFYYLSFKSSSSISKQVSYQKIVGLKSLTNNDIIMYFQQYIHVNGIYFQVDIESDYYRIIILLIFLVVQSNRKFCYYDWIFCCCFIDILQYSYLTLEPLFQHVLDKLKKYIQIIFLIFL